MKASIKVPCPYCGRESNLDCDIAAAEHVILARCSWHVSQPSDFSFCDRPFAVKFKVDVHATALRIESYGDPAADEMVKHKGWPNRETFCANAWLANNSELHKKAIAILKDPDDVIEADAAQAFANWFDELKRHSFELMFEEIGIVEMVDWRAIVRHMRRNI